MKIHTHKRWLLLAAICAAGGMAYRAQARAIAAGWEMYVSGTCVLAADTGHGKAYFTRLQGAADGRKGLRTLRDSVITACPTQDRGGFATVELRKGRHWIVWYRACGTRTGALQVPHLPLNEKLRDSLINDKPIESVLAFRDGGILIVFPPVMISDLRSKPRSGLLLRQGQWYKVDSLPNWVQGVVYKGSLSWVLPVLNSDERLDAIDYEERPLASLEQLRAAREPAFSRRVTANRLTPGFPSFTPVPVADPQLIVIARETDSRQGYRYALVVLDRKGNRKGGGFIPPIPEGVFQLPLRVFFTGAHQYLFLNKQGTIHRHSADNR
jgi:hypothetical protein